MRVERPAHGCSPVDAQPRSAQIPAYPRLHAQRAVRRVRATLAAMKRGEAASLVHVRIEQGDMGQSGEGLGVDQPGACPHRDFAETLEASPRTCRPAADQAPNVTRRWEAMECRA